MCVLCHRKKDLKVFVCGKQEPWAGVPNACHLVVLVHEGPRHAVDFRWINTVHTSVDTSGGERSAFLFGKKKTDLPSASSTAEGCRKSGANISNLLTLPLLRKTHPFLQLGCGYIWSLQTVPHTPHTKTYLLNIGFIFPRLLPPFGPFFWCGYALELSGKASSSALCFFAALFVVCSDPRCILAAVLISLTNEQPHLLLPSICAALSLIRIDCRNGKLELLQYRVFKDYIDIFS